MRCPDCNRFVSFDEPQVEEQNAEIEDNEVVGEVRVVLPCAECGTELKEGYMDFSISLDGLHECDEDKIEEGKFNPDDDDQYELDGDLEYTPIDTTKKKKRMLGASITGTVKCLRCGEIFKVETEVMEESGYFDECC